MRKLTLAIAMYLLVQFLGVVISHSVSAADDLPQSGFVPNELLISLTPEAVSDISEKELYRGRMGLSSLDEVHARLEVETISTVFRAQGIGNDPIAEEEGLTRIFKLTLAPGADVFSVLQGYSEHPDVEFAELNLVYAATLTPSDTRFRKQWALHNRGQEGGQRDADIDAREAWNIHQGDSQVIIAIVDTGVDHRHQDLAGGGRVLTDKDFDFVNEDDNAMDDHGHGTYVAGIAAADSDNGKGVSGVCWGCRILPVKVLNSDGEGTAEWVAQGIRYAARRKADVINMSLGAEAGCGCSQTIARAINYAWRRGSLLVAASGNDSDKEVISYPAASPRVAAIGASNRYDREARFSNLSDRVDLLAPGEDILGLDPRPGEPRYRVASGTSAAAPHASGVAGLIWSVYPDLENNQIWRVLRSTTDAMRGSLPGRLNAFKALKGSSFRPWSAAPDKCSEELSCPPGCGAEVVLAPEEEFSSIAALLRGFRSRVLEETSLGREWSRLYRDHRLEVALILIEDEHFRAAVRDNVRLWLPIIRAAVDGKADVELTARQVAAVYATLEGFMARGSQRLRDDLESVQSALEEHGFLDVGLTEVDLLRKLNAR